MALSRSFIGFLATEIPLLMVGLMAMPPPVVLVVGSTFAVWFWLWVWLSSQEAQPFFERISNDADFIQQPGAVVLSALASLVLAVAIGPFMESRLWESGNFGEPPDNRYVSHRHIEHDDGEEWSLVEFAVTQVPIPTFSIQVIFRTEPRLNGKWRTWLGPPGTNMVPPKGSGFPSIGTQNPRTVQIDSVDVWVIAFSPINRSIRPDKSFYIFSSNEAIHDILACWFGPNTTEGFEGLRFLLANNLCDGI